MKELTDKTFNRFINVEIGRFVGARPAADLEKMIQRIIRNHQKGDIFK